MSIVYARLRKNEDGTITVSYSSPQGKESMVAAFAMFATGRIPNVQNLGLEVMEFYVSYDSICWLSLR